MDKNKAKNPWLTIPAADYENHMNSPDVNQLRFLSNVFKMILSSYHPTSILVVGCATGNGFEHINFDTTERVVAIDINLEYLNILRKRYSKYLNKIELICNDVNDCKFEPNTFDLIHCALLFEYVNPAKTVRNITKWLSSNGVLTVVLQLPDKTSKPVSDTPFNSLKRLDKIMHLVNPQEFNQIALSNYLTQVSEEITQLKSAKEFYISIYGVKSRPSTQNGGQAFYKDTK
jgi:ubiquinone/menaquinone biosynthesis C-methylase UbiE